MHGRRQRFRAQQVRRTDLHGRRAEHERSSDTATIGDTAGCNHRNMTASTTRGTSAMVPGWAATSAVRNIPRCPPASAPWAITTSHPWLSSHIASATVVAEDITAAPVERTRSMSSGDGRPKWKLTTSGRHRSTRWHASSSKGCRDAPAGGLRGRRRARRRSARALDSTPRTRRVRPEVPRDRRS